jgi:hypothetical protein
MNFVTLKRKAMDNCEICEEHEAEMDFNAMIPLEKGLGLVQGFICSNCFMEIGNDFLIALAILHKRHPEQQEKK